MRLCYDCGSPIPATDALCPRCGTKTGKPDDPLIGTIFTDKYEIEAKLGSGGMCDVYRARHVRIGKAVAIKILRPEFAADPKITERFEREARAASLVRHPNAISIMDYGVAAGNTPFLVMELVDGATVRELLKQHGAMTVERVAGIVAQACGALEAAHSVGVIHRDIKPENIIITEYDGRDWVEVVDFGIAKIQEDMSRRAALTGANLIIGTPRYMSPEQAQEQTVDARSDIYSFAVVVYEMLAGGPPFSGGSATRLLIAHTVEPPPPLATARPDIQPAVAAVVMRALEKDPARRQQSAAEFAREFATAVAAAHAPVAQATQGTPPGRFNAPLAEVNLVDRMSEDATPFEDEDEETLVRRASRASRQAAAASSAKGEHHKRIPVALIVGLLAVVVAGILVTYFTTRKHAPESLAIQQKNDHAASANANAGGAPASSAPTASAPVPAPATPTNTSNPPPAAGAETSPPTAENSTAVNQVRDAVSRWNAALEARNLDAHLSYYAPHLHTYFLKDNVDRSTARAEVAAALSRYSKLKIRTSPLAISVDPSGNHAVVTFEKDWNFEGKQPWSGAAVERLWLDRLNGRWRITGVRDLKQLR